MATGEVAEAVEAVVRPSRSGWAMARRRLFRNRAAMGGLITLILIVMVAFLAEIGRASCRERV